MNNNEFTNNHTQNTVEYVQDDFSEVKIDLFEDTIKPIKDKNGNTNSTKSDNSGTSTNIVTIVDRISIDSDAIVNFGDSDIIEIELD